MELREITEGNTDFAVPVIDENADFPPASAPVFYNSRMEFNRDMAVLFCKTVTPENYLDAMAATGVRGLRIANEVHIPVTINDRNQEAADLIKENSKKFDEDIRVTCDDANRLMYSEKFDAVDLDPFGSPIPFLDAASRSAKNYLYITATDTAPLCGAHFQAGRRRYFSTPKNTEYHAEVGLRIMLFAAARELVKYDRGMQPLLSFADQHYFRTFVKILPHVTAADETLSQIGFIMQCPNCLYRGEQKGSLLPKTHHCPYCGIETEAIGPLWMGSISDKQVIRSMIGSLPDMKLRTEKKIEKMLNLLISEPEGCSFYDYHVISKTLKMSPPNMSEMIDGLNDLGYKTARTHFAPTGIKTEASLDVLEKWIIDWNKKKYQSQI